ncbi:MAG: iron-sulfur cluster assembly scaffold protein [Acidobacteriota bacterium]
MTDLYRAVILDHDRAPRNCGPLAGATHEATVDNPLCGDVVTMRAIVDGDIVRAAAFEAHGCALARAGASMVTTRAANASIADLRALAAELEQLVRGPPGAPIPPVLGELAAFAGVRAARSRRTCATLGFRALLAALEQK